MMTLEEFGPDSTLRLMQAREQLILDLMAERKEREETDLLMRKLREQTVN